MKNHPLLKLFDVKVVRYMCITYIYMHVKCHLWALLQKRPMILLKLFDVEVVRYMCITYTYIHVKCHMCIIYTCIYICIHVFEV